eukprot:scaffold604_cov59-Phaeocystis_antarctica.AAC.4
MAMLTMVLLTMVLLTTTHYRAAVGARLGRPDAIAWPLAQRRLRHPRGSSHRRPNPTHPYRTNPALALTACGCRFLAGVLPDDAGASRAHLARGPKSLPGGLQPAGRLQEWAARLARRECDEGAPHLRAAAEGAAPRLRIVAVALSVCVQ